MKEFLNMTKALADENRLRMLMALRDGEVCVCQIAEWTGLALSTVSKHLSVLYQAGLVSARKEGRWMFYSLPGKGAPTAAREAVAWVRRSLEDNQRITEDAKHLKKVLGMDIGELCKRQCCK
jgi:ArsR family transcriptional regulator, arsenate/arsenite/antimonite-responsive transcriptional repressor